ncbi:MAG TPA: arylesterase [Sphingomonadales bacterium]|nr:arylesterase [Sphingomonadales bacterium]
MTPVRLLAALLSAAFFFLAPAQAGGESEKVVLALGDSLMAGYGLPPGVSFPAKLERWLRAQGIAATVVNSGVSGDTSTGGRERLAWSLDAFPPGQPHLVILEFGANDMLRGLEPALTRANLSAMLRELTARNIKVILFGMRAAPNLGARYSEEFNSIFPELARQYGTAFVPFYLEGVAGVSALNLEDGIHPNAAGLDIMVENAGPAILELLDD